MYSSWRLSIGDEIKIVKTFYYYKFSTFLIGIKITLVTSYIKIVLFIWNLFVKGKVSFIIKYLVDFV